MYTAAAQKSMAMLLNDPHSRKTPPLKALGPSAAARNALKKCRNLNACFLTERPLGSVLDLIWSPALRSHHPAMQQEAPSASQQVAEYFLTVEWELTLQEPTGKGDQRGTQDMVAWECATPRSCCK
jgi:hypothetical protein